MFSRRDCSASLTTRFIRFAIGVSTAGSNSTKKTGSTWPDSELGDVSADLALLIDNDLVPELALHHWLLARHAVFLRAYVMRLVSGSEALAEMVFLGLRMFHDRE